MGSSVIDIYIFPSLYVVYLQISGSFYFWFYYHMIFTLQLTSCSFIIIRSTSYNTMKHVLHAIKQKLKRSFDYCGTLVFNGLPAILNALYNYMMLSKMHLHATERVSTTILTFVAHLGKKLVCILIRKLWSAITATHI